jgi:hypothetical protein
MHIGSLLYRSPAELRRRPRGKNSQNLRKGEKPMSKTKNLSKVLALVIMLALVIGVMPMAASATTTGWVSVAEGEMIAIDWTLTGTNTYTGTVVDAYTLSSTTYTMPHSFVLWAHSTPTAPTYTCGTGITVTYLYDSYTDETMTDMSKAYRVDVSGIDENDTSDLTFITADGTYTVTLPAATAGATGGSFPSYVNGYLPVGQYAVGASWGGIFVNAFNNNGSTTKFTVDGTGGVSLGACGGYIQFEFENAIQNNPSNPYGVDFIVYGNAFSTNAEAGSVQVSNDGTTWYELAGSRYYKAETLRNVNVSYRLFTDLDEVQRVQYKIWDLSGQNNTEHVYKDWDYLKQPTPTNPNTMPNTKGWWPMYDANTENYGTISGVSTALRGTAAVNKAAWSNSNNTITFYGVTLVEDEDNASEYTFGYADVHGNGTYGVASNPYAAGQNTAGGDGFDISWAVKADGTPIALSEVKYVRVYTSAGIKYTNNAPYIFVHDAFNETSTEVCGLFVASGTGSGTSTSTITIKTGTSTRNLATVTTSHMGTYAQSFGSNVNTAYVQVTSNADYIYVNGELRSSGTNLSFDISSGTKYVQIITQDGTESPYITVLRLSQ